MHMSGEQRIAAPRQRVWEALNDPEVLKRCIPGCQSLEKQGDDRFDAVAEVKVGPIGARFKGTVQLSDLDAPNGYTITGQGSGGVAGFAKGGAKVRLSDDGAGTLVSYDVNAEVGGRMAQLGGPIIDATAKNLAGKFFSTFGEVVGGEVVGGAVEAAPATPAPVAAASIASSGSAQPAAGRGSFCGMQFVVALAILAGYVLGRSTAADWWVVAVIALVAIAAAAGYETGRMSGDKS